jgi:hypothetical protein
MTPSFLTYGPSLLEATFIWLGFPFKCNTKVTEFFLLISSYLKIVWEIAHGSQSEANHAPQGTGADPEAVFTPRQIVNAGSRGHLHSADVRVFLHRVQNQLQRSRNSIIYFHPEE